MFELESKNPDIITVKTAKNTINFNMVEGEIDADLAVGKIEGPGEFEIGDATIRGIDAKEGRTIYDIEIGGVHIGVTGDVENALDELGVSDILCTSSVKAIREIEPKLVVATGNVDGMVTELKLTARTEKKLKIKKIDNLPNTLEVVVFN